MPTRSHSFRNVAITLKIIILVCIIHRIAILTHCRLKNITMKWTNSLHFQSFTHRKCNLQSNKFKNYSVLSGFQHLLFCFATATLDTLIFLDEKQKQFHIHHAKKMNFVLKLVNKSYQDFYSHVENNYIIAKEYQTNVLFTLIYHFCVIYMKLKKAI